MAALCLSAIADRLMTKRACPLPGPQAAAELLPYAGGFGSRSQLPDCGLNAGF